MKKTILALAAAAAALTITPGAWPDQIESLRHAAITATSVEPERRKLMEVEGGIERSYKEQPPMVPHEVDKYDINIKYNGCLKCHSPETYEKEKAPVMGEAHFLDRDGNKLEHLSPLRYFCTQCHVAQLTGAPLVENLFEGRK